MKAKQTEYGRGLMYMNIGLDCRDWVVGLVHGSDQATAGHIYDGPVYNGPISGLPSDVLKELIERGFVTENSKV